LKAAVIAIGVDRTGGGLTKLSGAASGAKDFAKWADRQKMCVELLTDAGSGAVRLNDIIDKVESIIKQGTFGKLVIYFAGHGFLLSPQSELWLLSDAPGRATEAVNVQLSRDHARYCGIPHVIFVSDACRSGGANHQHRSVTGGSCFPVPSVYHQDGEVDTFYGTRPGDPALEYPDDKGATDNYKGVFTECLLEVLEGGHPEVVEKAEVAGSTRWVIPSRKLKEKLKDTVPDRAASISIKLMQVPEVRVESVLPLYFGELSGRPLEGLEADGVNESDHPPASKGPDFEHLNAIFGVDEQGDSAFTSMRGESVSASELEFVKQSLELVSTEGRPSFETSCGFTIQAPVLGVYAGNGLPIEHWEEEGRTQVRIHDAWDHPNSSLLVRFQNGSGSVFAIKQDYVGNVQIKDGRVINVNYTPSASTSLYFDEYEPNRDRIDRRRAFVATATRHGIFEPKESEAEDAAEFLRMMKSVDPTLGIYAAYAYQETGKLHHIRNVLNYMKNDPLPVPFDVVLLARPDSVPLYAPFCPMLNQGWALLDLFPAITKKIATLRSMLEPGLWTTFTPSGVNYIRSKFESGELN